MEMSQETSDPLLARYNEIAMNLATHYSDKNEHLITVNNISISIPFMKKKNSFIDPNQWLNSKHCNNSIHEPGLVSALLFLSEQVGEEKVYFVDVGSLFGYFSILAQKIFSNPEILSVEANTQSCEVIREILASCGDFEENIKINNVLIGASSNTRRFIMDGMKFHEFSWSSYAIRLIQEIFSYRCIKNVGRFILKGRVSFPLGIVELPEMGLADFLSKTITDREATVILKLDTEGHQSTFLPPATSFLINMNAVILLEFDSQEKMSRFKTSNLDLCKPFLAAGYRLFWLDHRRRGESAIELHSNDIGEQFEKNSLGILLPPVFSKRPEAESAPLSDDSIVNS